MQIAEYHRMYENEDTHWWYVSLHDLILSFLPEEGRDRLRIFDAGCGTGRLLQLLAERADVRGCDISDISLQYCRARGLTQVERANLNGLDLETAGYDAVTSIDVLYHQWVLDDRRILKKLYQGLKPGGRLILQVPAYEWLRSDHDKAVLTGRRYTRGKIVAMLKDCGFEIEKATYRVSLLFLPIALLRTCRQFSGSGGKEKSPNSDVRKHSPGVNSLLAAVMKVENLMLKQLSFPFGSSVFAVARKPGRCTGMI
jgi:SAM-dependent methyltransferase